MSLNGRVSATANISPVKYIVGEEWSQDVSLTFILYVSLYKSVALCLL